MGKPASSNRMHMRQDNNYTSESILGCLIVVMMLGLAYLLQGCASVTNPEGGPKDETKPRLVNINPLKGTNNFNKKELILEFDEDVKLSNIQEQLLITPAFRYKALATGQKVKLSIEEDLKPNTTYFLSFRDGIQDVTEGNIPDSTELVFSTGNNIDSLEINGHVKDASTLVDVDNAIVGLYAENDTINVSKHKPLYTTRTNKEGHFRFRYLPSGTFKLIAFTDKNKDNLYSQLNEQLGYISELVKAGDKTEQEIYINGQTLDTLRLFDVEHKPSWSVLNLNRGIEKWNFEGASIPQYAKLIDKQLWVHTRKLSTDSLVITAELTDSIGFKLTKQITLKRSNQPDTTGRKEPYFKTSIQSTPKVIPTIGITFTSKDSITTIDTSKIKLINEKLKSISYEYGLSKQGTTLTIIPKTAVKGEAKLMTTKGFLKSILDSTYRYQDTLKLNWANEEDYGTIAYATKAKGDYIIQLIDKAGQIVAEVHKKEAYTFRWLQPGEYSIRRVEDKNNNRRWDPGNLKRGTQPEPIHYVKDKINVKANWDITDVIVP